MKIKNLEKVAERIKVAVGNGERVILYGDSDMDGISSTVLVQEAIETIGGKVDLVCFPNREQDGYGLNFKALEFLKEKAPALLVTLDLGIGNVAEVEQANAMGFEVAIVDHHRPKDKIPNASIVVNPYQPGDESEFKALANVGLAYLLAKELVGDAMTHEQESSILELAALGTIADMMPQENINVTMVEKGLQSLKNTQRQAFKAFFEIFEDGRRPENPVQVIISALGVAESAGWQNKAYTLLREQNLLEAKALAQELLGKLMHKQEQIQSIMEEVERRIALKPGEPIIFEGDPAWRLVLAGSVASQLVRKYNKPIFIYKKMDGESTGSVRSVEGLDSVVAMRACQDLLITYGGHPMASGFRLKNENLEAFKQRLIEYFQTATN